MANRFGEDALKEFNVALDELEANLRFLRAASRLRPRLGSILRWETVEPDAKALVQDYVSEKSVEVTLLYRGMAILLAGAFEELVRRLVHDAVLIINQSTKNYDSLTDVIKIQNTFRTGRALAAITQPPDHLVIDYYTLSRNIATCVPGGVDFTLNANAFGFFISSVSPSHLADILKTIGVELHWDDFGQDPNLRTAFNKKDTRETAKVVQGYLGRFIQMRNKIAHTGSGGIAVTDTDIEELLRFFRAFCDRLAQVVYENLPERVGKKR